MHTSLISLCIHRNQGTYRYSCLCLILGLVGLGCWEKFQPLFLFLVKKQASWKDLGLDFKATWQSQLQIRGGSPGLWHFVIRNSVRDIPDSLGYSRGRQLGLQNRSQCSENLYPDISWKHCFMLQLWSSFPRGACQTPSLHAIRRRMKAEQSFIVLLF